MIVHVMSSVQVPEQIDKLKLELGIQLQMESMHFKIYSSEAQDRSEVIEPLVGMCRAYYQTIHKVVCYQ